MNYKRCVYFVEGPCEKKLIDALKAEKLVVAFSSVLCYTLIKANFHSRADLRSGGVNRSIIQRHSENSCFYPQPTLKAGAFRIRPPAMQ